mgnify:CR=1 FL=1
MVPALDLVVTRDEMRALKPDPDGWRVIAAHFGAHQDAVVVGDSWVDGVAATAAGIPFVAYRPNEADIARWKLEPVARLDDLAALPAWLRRRANGEPEERHGAVRAAGQRGGTPPAGPLADPHAAARARRGRGPGAPAGAGRILRASIESGELHSMILWGPPGSARPRWPR